MFSVFLLFIAPLAQTPCIQVYIIWVELAQKLAVVVLPI